MKNEFRSRFLRLFSVNALAKLGGFLLLPVYLELMSPEEFGRYSYFFSVIGMLALVYSFGQHVTLSRFFHTKEYDRDTLIETIHVVMFFSIIITTALIIIFKDSFLSLLFKFPVSDLLFYSGVAVAFLLNFNQILMTFFYQSEQVKHAQKKIVVELFLLHIFCLGMLFYFDSFPADLIRVLGAATANGIVFILFYHHFLQRKNLKLSSVKFSLAKRSVRNGFPHAIATFLNFFIGFGDRFVVEKILDESQLGVFSFALVVSGALMVLFTSFYTVWLPYHFKEKKLKTSLKRLHKIFFLYLGIGAGFLFFAYSSIFFFGRYFVDQIYLGSLDFLWLLIGAGVFQASVMLLGAFYQIFEKIHIASVVNVFACIGNVSLNFYFVKSFELFGAALATLIISLILFFTHYLICRFYIKKGNFGEYS